ncbi:hypothetical protein FBY34_8782 [Streptomyces sp. SLBN-115]|nr:hypothetical protein FBY34_8782 [Streptomyces sp. SLBN-115]
MVLVRTLRTGCGASRAAEQPLVARVAGMPPDSE